MKASEFVGRVLTIFREDFADVFPDDFATAHVQLLQANNAANKPSLTRILDGFTFHASAVAALDHQIIQVKMAASKEKTIRASVCFTFQDFEAIWSNNSTNLYENYDLSFYFKANETELVEMLAYLTLKTTNPITKKFNR